MEGKPRAITPKTALILFNCMKNTCKPQYSKCAYVSTCFINYISQYGQELVLCKIQGSTRRGTTVKSSGNSL